jgi:hypothetical protein
MSYHGSGSEVFISDFGTHVFVARYEKCLQARWKTTHVGSSLLLRLGLFLANSLWHKSWQSYQNRLKDTSNHHLMKAYNRSGYKAPRSLDLGIRWVWSFSHSRILPPEYTEDRRQGRLIDSYLTTLFFQWSLCSSASIQTRLRLDDRSSISDRRSDGIFSLPLRTDRLWGPTSLLS